MGKRLTISNRWKEWALAEPVWANLCLFCFMFSMMGLGIHLGILGGFWRTAGLWILLAGDSGAIAITAFRKQWWWCAFFGVVTATVIVFEIASYFWGSTI